MSELDGRKALTFTVVYAVVGSGLISTFMAVAAYWQGYVAGMKETARIWGHG